MRDTYISDEGQFPGFWTEVKLARLTVYNLRKQLQHLPPPETSSAIAERRSELLRRLRVLHNA